MKKNPERLDEETMSSFGTAEPEDAKAEKKLYDKFFLEISRDKIGVKLRKFNFSEFCRVNNMSRLSKMTQTTPIKTTPFKPTATRTRKQLNLVPVKVPVFATVPTAVQEKPDPIHENSEPEVEVTWWSKIKRTLTTIKDTIVSLYTTIRSATADVYLASTTAAYFTSTYLLPLAPFVTYTARKTVKHLLVKLGHPFLAFELSEATSAFVAFHWFSVVTAGYFVVFMNALLIYTLLSILYGYYFCG